MTGIRLGASLLAASSILVVSACGSSTTSTPATSLTTDSTSTVTSSPAAPTTPSPTGPAYKQLTSTQLVAALPTVADLPVGYSAEKPKTTASNESTFCGYKVPSQPTAYAEGDYDGTGLTYAQVTLRQYSSTRDATAQQDALEQALGTCHSMMSQGKKVDIAEMSAPKLGDRTLGVQISQGGFAGVEIFVQVGPTVIQVSQGGVVTANLGQVTKLARSAMSKYKPLATS